ncbi:hypothetical protein C1645_831080 [Glomus cerebriforme]|uniref:Uncharacterized protein n=1 Tax=Glomus cerebriforme TaxID=658196 RepID=A0A397SKP8_9GLOM|nr:hypothetical protein C1645_831080 [Glomus cerebriforme]
MLPLKTEVIRKYKTNELINFLRKEKDLGSYGMPSGPASDLAYIAKELEKYGIDSNDRKIPPIVFRTCEKEDNDEELEQIKRRMGIICSTGSNKSVSFNYISAMLYRRITKKGISLDPQFEIDGDEITGHVDYAIKEIIDVVNEDPNHTSTRKGKRPWNSIMSLTTSTKSSPQPWTGTSSSTRTPESSLPRIFWMMMRNFVKPTVLLTCKHIVHYESTQAVSSTGEIDADVTEESIKSEILPKTSCRKRTNEDTDDDAEHRASSSSVETI